MLRVRVLTCLVLRVSVCLVRLVLWLSCGYLVVVLSCLVVSSLVMSRLVLSHET